MIKLLADGYTREQFLEVRKNRIGGSDIAAIAGLNSFRTPLQVWAEKTERTNPVTENLKMWWGSKIEPQVAELFTKITGYEIKRVGEVWQHSTMDWAIATPDYQIKDLMADYNDRTDNLVEIKTTSINGARYWTDETAADAAALQLQWQLEIGGIEGGYCACLIAGDPDNLKTPYMERSRDIGYQLLEQGSKFMQLVWSDTPPAATGKDVKLIEELYKDRTEEEIQLGPEAAVAFKRYDELKALVKRYEDEQAAIKAQLMSMVGSATKGVLGDRRAYYTPYKRKAFTSPEVNKQVFKVD